MGFHYEQDLDKMFFQNSDFFSNVVFDKTRIKSLSEKPLLPQEFKVKQILPMVQIDGILFLTNKRAYFQPYNSFHSKLVLNFKFKEMKELFKRRYRLMDLGLEFTTKRGEKKKNLYIAFHS